MATTVRKNPFYYEATPNPQSMKFYTTSQFSDETAFFYEGELIEFGDTTHIFTNPEKKQTEDYITGRFG